MLLRFAKFLGWVHAVEPLLGWVQFYFFWGELLDLWWTAFCLLLICQLFWGYFCKIVLLIVNIVILVIILEMLMIVLEIEELIIGKILSLIMIKNLSINIKILHLTNRPITIIIFLIGYQIDWILSWCPALFITVHFQLI